jgi:hypothetical protein
MVFSAERGGPTHLFYKRFDDDKDRELRPASNVTLAEDISPDGPVACHDLSEAAPRVVWTLDPDRSGDPVPLMTPKFNVEDLRFSPNRTARGIRVRGVGAP